MNNIYSRGVYKYDDSTNYLKLISEKFASAKFSNTVNSFAGILGTIAGFIMLGNLF